MTRSNPVADGPFRDVRPRARKDKSKTGDSKDTCSCGLPFQYVGMEHGGTKRFFWCSRCDKTEAA